MTGAILKLQYKKAGQSDLSGKIIGCFFFVSKNTIATCHHVLNKNSLLPEKSFNFCVHYLLMDGEIIVLTNEMLSEFPEIDVTFVHLKKPYNVSIPSFSKTFTPLNLLVRNEAYNTATTSFIDIGWNNDIPMVNSVNLESIKIEQNGYISDRTEENWEKANPQGIQLRNAKCVVTNYGGKAGSSGSALFSSKTNELIGMIWGGEKRGSNAVKQFYAISSIEIADRMKKIGLTKLFWKFWKNN